MLFATMSWPDAAAVAAVCGFLCFLAWVLFGRD